MMSDNTDHVDSDKEFNERLCKYESKSVQLLAHLQQQMIDIESRFLQLEAKLGAFDVRFAERCEYVEKMVTLYRENIAIFDREIERAQSLKFKLVEYSHD